MRIVECNMPDLSDLSEKKVVHRFLVCQLTGAGVGFPPKQEAYRTNIARLVDKAVSEYAFVRCYALAEIDQRKRSTAEVQEYGSFTYVLSISNELENCIITTRRLILCFDRIKLDDNSQPVSRILRRQISSLETGIKNVRDAYSAYG